MATASDEPPAGGVATPAKRAAAPWSITKRLGVAAAVWSSVALIVVGALLLELFQTHVERQFDAALRDDLVQLVALSQVGRRDAVVVSGALTGSRYERPFSGWSWQISRGGQVLVQSGSLGPVSEDAPLLSAPAGAVGPFLAPGEARARGLSRVVRLNQRSAPILVSVARPQADLDDALAAFARLMIAAFCLLGLGLVLAVIVLLRIGLKPLGALREKVLALREGTVDAGASTPETWPRELSPIADELDDLRADLERLVADGRGRAADLAHAVKTPLAVIHQLAETLDGEATEALQKQTRRIEATLNRHLTRARAAVAIRGRRSRVDTCLADIGDALRREFDGSGVAFSAQAPPSWFAGDESDLYEMLGALIDNARRWATARVEARVAMDLAGIRIEIHDDGPGVPPSQREAIFARGVRLDEQEPGQGLGLPIVRDLAQLYGGAVAIGDSPLGGACVSVALPGVLEAARA